MRTLCDVCEKAAAIFFCAADEAALCSSCDKKVHMCNKLASRHMRVGLSEPSDVPQCDICETQPAFFYCGVDGISLCLQCDMIVHVGGKRTHGRYLLMKQIVEFPGDNKSSLPSLKPNKFKRNQVQPPQRTITENEKVNDTMNDSYDKKISILIDLNSNPPMT